ncbi:MAG: ATP-grasp domain-containing protein [Coriobacteriaceae bacterium]|nr:ATP-grasp domain-containing protein [Coriobacteriaceae bacterium]
MEREECPDKETRPCEEDPAAQVVVVGRGYANILNMVRSFGQAGFAVDVLRVFKNPASAKRPLLSMKPEASSRYVRRYEQCVAPQGSRVAQALLGFAQPGAKKLLVPVDDFVALAIDQAREELSPHFLLPSVGGDTAHPLSFYMRKDVQKAMAQEAGLSVVAGRVLDTKAWRPEDARGISFPCFVKPNVSALSSKAKIARCDTPEQLDAALARYALDGEGEALVEDCVDVAEELSVIGVCMDGASHSPAFVRSLVGGRGQRRGVMLTGEVLPASMLGDIAPACDRLVQATGFEGVFDIDLLVARDGSVYFAELNFRPGASTYALVAAGANLPGAFARFALTGSLDDAPLNATISRTVFANEKVLLEECATGGMTPSAMRKLMREADITFIRNEEDPAPYRVFAGFERKARLLWLRAKMRKLVR